MKTEDVLGNTENVAVEFKENWSDRVLEAISGFSNTDGGTIYIGVTDKGQVVGIQVTNSSLGDLTNRIVSKLGIHPRIDAEHVGDKTILKIEVPQSTVPISYDGRYYKRVGNTTRRMKPEELQAFFTRRAYWDTLTGTYRLDEIDPATVKKFIRMAKASGRLPQAEESDEVGVVLEKLRLVMDGKLTNGAIMLFGVEPQRHFINAVVRVGRFKDPTTIIGDRLIEGNLFNQVEQAMQAMQIFLNVRYEITGEQLARKTIWDYPLPAVREALLNAVIHRDYFRHSVQTQIKVFDDHVWFFNIGGLPEGITLDQLTRPHPSVARNPLLVHVFYLTGMIEEYGSGIERITDALVEAGLPEPEWKEEFGGFSLRIGRDPRAKERLEAMGMSERQIRAVEFIKENGSISNKQYRDLTGLSDEKARRDLRELIAIGILERRAKGRRTHYVLR